MSDRHSVPGGDRLRDSKDKQVGIRWPVALDQRLDDLVQRANDAGSNTNRRELIAALLLAADHDGDGLNDVVRTYRKAVVRDAPLAPDDHGADVLDFERHRPGPRTSA
ncbi:hypothetical protein SAMN04489844_1478 [Nocardioides exalbidus]|uniref:Uncharacterized protein n=1 Tax=Nocardioides exalbidus TaxID=402596 RepID=A0A1H4NXN6_9ACTN|nr:hypothetical protein [Nocardioides exalbidus]SEB99924.1 hypothetical protein SAMN04489844_1478 [Nocardioides exalbidus]